MKYAPKRPGPAIKLEYYGASQGRNVEPCVFPYYKDFSIGATQETRKPISELYKTLTDAITQGVSTANSTVSTFIGVAQQLSDIFGVKFAGKGFYALSWKEGSNGDFSLSINLHRGWMDKWSASKEVLEPLMEIKEHTVPYDGDTYSGSTLYAPLPATGGVFAEYGAQMLSTLPTAIANIADTGKSLTSSIPLIGGVLSGLAEGVSNLAGGTGKSINSVSGSVLDTIKSTGLLGGGMWQVNFGYWDTNKFISYFQMVNCVCVGSNLSYSKEMEKDGDTVSPIIGTLELTMKTQAILTSSQFSKIKGTNSYGNSEGVRSSDQTTGGTVRNTQQTDASRPEGSK